MSEVPPVVTHAIRPQNRKLTYAEYVARAMLIPNAGYFRLSHLISVHVTDIKKMVHLDPDTLEPVSADARLHRFNAATKNNNIRLDIEDWSNGKTYSNLSING